MTDYCDIREDHYGFWCQDHLEFTSHVATDGDTPVCEEYAKYNGCNCGHYDSTENDSAPVKTLRALSRALGDFDPYSCPEIERRVRDAVQGAVDQAIRDLKES